MTAKELKDQEVAESIERELEEAISDETIRWLEARARANDKSPDNRHAIISDAS